MIEFNGLSKKADKSIEGHVLIKGIVGVMIKNKLLYYLILILLPFSICAQETFFGFIVESDFLKNDVLKESINANEHCLDTSLKKMRPQLNEIKSLENTIFTKKLCFENRYTTSNHEIKNHYILSKKGLKQNSKKTSAKFFLENIKPLASRVNVDMCQCNKHRIAQEKKATYENISRNPIEVPKTKYEDYVKKAIKDKIQKRYLSLMENIMMTTWEDKLFNKNRLNINNLKNKIPDCNKLTYENSCRIDEDKAGKILQDFLGTTPGKFIDMTQKKMKESFSPFAKDLGNKKRQQSNSCLDNSPDFFYKNKIASIYKDLDELFTKLNPDKTPIELLDLLEKEADRYPNNKSLAFSPYGIFIGNNYANIKTVSGLGPFSNKEQALSFETKHPKLKNIFRNKEALKVFVKNMRKVYSENNKNQSKAQKYKTMNEALNNKELDNKIFDSINSQCIDMLSYFNDIICSDLSKYQLPAKNLNEIRHTNAKATTQLNLPDDITLSVIQLERHVNRDIFYPTDKALLNKHCTLNNSNKKDASYQNNDHYNRLNELLNNSHEVPLIDKYKLALGSDYESDRDLVPDNFKELFCSCKKSNQQCENKPLKQSLKYIENNCLGKSTVPGKCPKDIDIDQLKDLYLSLSIFPNVDMPIVSNQTGKTLTKNDNIIEGLFVNTKTNPQLKPQTDGKYLTRKKRIKKYPKIHFRPVVRTMPQNNNLTFASDKRSYIPTPKINFNNGIPTTATTHVRDSQPLIKSSSLPTPRRIISAGKGQKPKVRTLPTLDFSKAKTSKTGTFLGSDIIAGTIKDTSSKANKVANLPELTFDPTKQDVTLSDTGSTTVDPKPKDPVPEDGQEMSEVIKRINKLESELSIQKAKNEEAKEQNDKKDDIIDSLISKLGPGNSIQNNDSKPQQITGNNDTSTKAKDITKDTKLKKGGDPIIYQKDYTGKANPTTLGLSDYEQKNKKPDPDKTYSVNEMADRIRNNPELFSKPAVVNITSDNGSIGTYKIHNKDGKTRYEKLYPGVKFFPDIRGDRSSAKGLYDNQSLGAESSKNVNLAFRGLTKYPLEAFTSDFTSKDKHFKEAKQRIHIEKTNNDQIFQLVIKQPGTDGSKYRNGNRYFYATKVDGKIVLLNGYWGSTKQDEKYRAAQEALAQL